MLQSMVVAERLLAHNGKNNITNRLIILRMLDILPRTWSCVKVLEENLSQYCKMFTGKIEATDEEVRKIEKKWTLKLCRILESLGRDKTTGNPRIIKILRQLSDQTGSDFKFTLGSPALKNQVKNWTYKDEVNAQNKVQQTMSPKKYTEILKKRIAKAKIPESENSSLFSTDSKKRKFDGHDSSVLAPFDQNQELNMNDGPPFKSLGRRSILKESSDNEVEEEESQIKIEEHILSLP